MSLDNPIRRPDLSSPDVMTRRAWWLVVLNFLLPGSAQVLAGSRRLGRFGLICTLVMWALVIVAVLSALFWRGALLSTFTQGVPLLFLQIVLIFYIVLWIVLTLDTLRLVKFVRVKVRSRWIVAALSVVLIVGVSATAGYAAVIVGSTRSFVDKVFVAGPSVAPINGQYSFLLLGGDAGEDRDGLRPDSMTVVTVDADTGKATMIGLTREMLQFPFSAGSPLYSLYPNGYDAHQGCGVDACKLAYLYTEIDVYHPDLYPDAAAKGSSSAIEAMKDAASGITGLPIQFYVMVDMNAFSELVDALGGVDVTVTERVPLVGVDYQGDGSDISYIEPGYQHMSGDLALWSARSRYDSTDYDRMQRQRQLQQAVIQQATPATILSHFQDIASAGAQVVKTDIPQSMLGYLADLALKTKDQPIGDLELVPPTIDPDYPDFDAIHQMVQQAVFDDQTASPTPSSG